MTENRYLTAATEAAAAGDLAGCAIYLRAAGAAWEHVALTAAERSRVAAMTDEECRETAEEMLGDAEAQADPTPTSVTRRHAGRSYRDPEFRRAARRLTWHGQWPEIDGDGDLTGLVISNEEGYANVEDEAVIETAVARRAGWTINDGYAVPPAPITVEVATCDETIRICGGLDDLIGDDYADAACRAYRSAVTASLADDPRAARLDVVSPRGQRILHSQWCGAHWSYECGAIGVMSERLSDDQRAAISAAHDAGYAAAKTVIDAVE